MLRLRLQRRGKRNYATYRVVVADRRAPIKGKFVADVGHYNPHTDVFKVDGEAVIGWLSKGVQPTPTVHNLLVEHKVIKDEKVTSWTPKKKEAEEGSGADDAALGDTKAEQKDAEAEKPEEDKEKKESEETEPEKEAK